VGTAGGWGERAGRVCGGEEKTRFAVRRRWESVGEGGGRGGGQERMSGGGRGEDRGERCGEGGRGGVRGEGGGGEKGGVGMAKWVGRESWNGGWERGGKEWLWWLVKRVGRGGEGGT